MAREHRRHGLEAALRAENYADNDFTRAKGSAERFKYAFNGNLELFNVFLLLRCSQKSSLYNLIRRTMLYGDCCFFCYWTTFCWENSHNDDSRSNTFIQIEIKIRNWDSKTGMVSFLMENKYFASHLFIFTFGEM